MEKSDELKLIEKVVTMFPRQSYFGEWLREHHPDIVRDITTDFPVNVPMPSQARREAANIIQAATLEAKQIVDRARATAKAELEAAYTKVSTIRRQGADALNRLAAQL